MITEKGKEKQQVLKQAYHLFNGFWTDMNVSKKHFKLLEYGLDNFGEADYILVEVLGKYEIRFDRKCSVDNTSWSYNRL